MTSDGIEGLDDQTIWAHIKSKPALVETPLNSRVVKRGYLESLLAVFNSLKLEASNKEAEHICDPGPGVVKEVEGFFTDMVLKRYGDPLGKVIMNLSEASILFAVDDEAGEFIDEDAVMFESYQSTVSLETIFEGLVYDTASCLLTGDGSLEARTMLAETLDTTEMPCLLLYLRDPTVSVAKETGAVSTMILPGLWSMTQYGLED